MAETPAMSPFGAKRTAEKEGSHAGGGLFGHKSPKLEVQPADMADIASQLSNISRRLRILEERYDGARKKIQLTEQTLLKQTKDVNKELKTTNSDVLGMKRDLEDLKGKARLIVKELMDCAKSDEVAVLEKYINLWEPINFVTRNEVGKIVKDAVEEALENIHLNEKI